jgi:hypothetical protein
MLSFGEVALLPWCECSTAVAISANFMMGGAQGGQVEGIGSWCDGQGDCGQCKAKNQTTSERKECRKSIATSSGSLAIRDEVRSENLE